MKFSRGIRQAERSIVAPCAGAWIEMYLTWSAIVLAKVAPCAGAWIEMQPCAACTHPL